MEKEKKVFDIFWGISSLSGKEECVCVRESKEGLGGNNYSSIKLGGSHLVSRAAPVDITPW